MYFKGHYGFQNIFVYKPTFNTLELKKAKRTDYVTGWKSRGLFKSTLPHYMPAFLPKIKYFGYTHDQNCKWLHRLRFR